MLNTRTGFLSKLNNLALFLRLLGLKWRIMASGSEGVRSNGCKDCPRERQAREKRDSLALLKTSAASELFSSHLRGNLLTSLVTIAEQGQGPS